MSFTQRFAVKTVLTLALPFISVENDEKFDTTTDPVIFAFNHNNSIETVLLAAFLLYRRNGAKVHFLVDWVFGYIPVLGSFIKLSDPIFVFNKKARFSWIDARNDRATIGNAFDSCVDRLRQRESIAIFPEGTRNHDPDKLLEGRTGIGKIVIESDATVVPVGVDFKKRRTHGRIPFFGFVTFRIGDRMNFGKEVEESRSIALSPEISGHARRKKMAYLQHKVRYAVMTEISKLSGKSYPFDPPAVPQ